MKSNHKPFRKCTCRWCSYWSPLLTDLMCKLPSDGDRQKLEEFVGHHLNVEQDNDVAQAKLNGDWPGWEWIKTHPLSEFGRIVKK